MVLACGCCPGGWSLALLLLPAEPLTCNLRKIRG